MPKISQVYLDRFKNMLLREEILWNDPILYMFKKFET